MGDLPGASLTLPALLKMGRRVQQTTIQSKNCPIPKENTWETLTAKRGAELEGHYNHSTAGVVPPKGFLGQIFTKSQNKIQDPAKLFQTHRI